MESSRQPVTKIVYVFGSLFTVNVRVDMVHFSSHLIKIHVSLSSACNHRVHYSRVPASQTCGRRSACGRRVVCGEERVINVVTLLSTVSQDLKQGLTVRFNFFLHFFHDIRNLFAPL